MKKAYALLSALAFLACLASVSPLLEGIRERGWNGVNYGRILFPLIIGIVFFSMYRKKPKAE